MMQSLQKTRDQAQIMTEILFLWQRFTDEYDCDDLCIRQINMELNSLDFAMTEKLERIEQRNIPTEPNNNAQ